MNRYGIKAISFGLCFVISISVFGCSKDTSVYKDETNLIVADSSNSIEDNNSIQAASDGMTSEKQEIDENAIKAEEEAKKAEEETKKKAEEEAKKAEEEARKKAEEEAKKAEEEAKKKAEEEAKKAEYEKLQKNSYAMLYYLAITAENIRTSKDNRLLLDDIYTSLLNDINPGAIDETTQEHLKNLRDIINKYMDISTKRDRLQFMYNQNKAAKIRSAVPNPLAILSMSGSLDWKRLAISTVYTVADSYNNYKKNNENVDNEFLMSGWDLNDEELDNVRKNRDRAFDYMVDMVQNYHLDGTKTLSEKDITKFSEICAIEEPTEKIHRLKAEKSTYELLGSYWLELADCYFETDKYSDCLDCIKKYNELYTGIYKKDANYAQLLPKAIVAAQNTYKGEKYITDISEYADEIVKNTETEDWATRYFAAQVYIDLYSKSNKQEYIDKAYKIAGENVTVLLKGQRDLNQTYLSEVQEMDVKEPNYMYMSEDAKKKAEKEFKKEKDRAKKYNDSLKKLRKTELPSLYEPLILNCELLFALADKKNISKNEQDEIDTILQAKSRGIFMVAPINEEYSFTSGTEKILMRLEKDTIVIPVSLLSSGAKVEIVIKDNGNETIINDCIISSVERKGEAIDEFSAKVVSKQWKNHKWTADSKVAIRITYCDAYDKVLEQKYKITEYEDHWYGDKVVFGEE